ncbi:MAG TPA: hypothetical protein VFT43_00540, partial [Candidatus Polarisedimenticolia bacterium]|nr:hypothetical protein [Candidatus Polarisedimenticolia bacterium]
DPASGRDNLRQAMARVPRSAFCLLVSHDPEVVETLGNWDIDMAFTGQERTGVLRPPPVGALFGSLGMGDDLEGWFDVAGGVRLHVSRGLGWRGLPIPGLCRPRIDLITLRGGSPPTRRAHRVIERS